MQEEGSTVTLPPRDAVEPVRTPAQPAPAPPPEETVAPDPQTDEAQQGIQPPPTGEPRQTEPRPEREPR